MNRWSRHLRPITLKVKLACIGNEPSPWTLTPKLHCRAAGLRTNTCWRRKVQALVSCVAVRIHLLISVNRSRNYNYIRNMLEISRLDHIYSADQGSCIMRVTNFNNVQYIMVVCIHSCIKCTFK